MQREFISHATAIITFRTTSLTYRLMEKKTVAIQLDPSVNIDSIINSIKVRSLWNSMR